MSGGDAWDGQGGMSWESGQGSGREMVRGPGEGSGFGDKVEWTLVSGLWLGKLH